MTRLRAAIDLALTLLAVLWLTVLAWRAGLLPEPRSQHSGLRDEPFGPPRPCPWCGTLALLTYALMARAMNWRATLWTLQRLPPETAHNAAIRGMEIMGSLSGCARRELQIDLARRPPDASPRS